MITFDVKYRRGVWQPKSKVLAALLFLLRLPFCLVAMAMVFVGIVILGIAVGPAASAALLSKFTEGYADKWGAR